MDTHSLTPYEEGALGTSDVNPYPKDSDKAKWWDDGRKYARIHKENPEQYAPQNQPSPTEAPKTVGPAPAVKPVAPAQPQT